MLWTYRTIYIFMGVYNVAIGFYFFPEGNLRRLR